MSDEPIRVLLVEDNPADADFLAERLSEAGLPCFVVTHVERISQALAHLAGSEVDVIVLDLELPDSQGLEGLVQTRRLAPMLPVVILSGQDDETLALQAIQLGAQDYLPKAWRDSRLLTRTLRYAMERKQLEQSRQESEARLRLVLENMPVMLNALDETMTFVVWNRECERVTGYPAAEIVGNPDAIKMLYPEAANRREMREAWARRGNNFRDWELHLTDRAGRRRTVAWSNISAQFPIPGWATWSVGLDITERRAAQEALAQKAEELARSNQELEQFAYIASHDLQEPLRMITSYLQLLQRRYQGQLDADAHEFIDFAVDGANRMKVLINDLLAYSRVERHGKPFEPADSGAALEQALANLTVAIAESEAVIRYDPLPAVLADPTQLAQVFQNLIGNALKFRTEAPPCIQIGAEQGQGEWRFSVRDNGIGLAPEAAERIFLLFERLHGRGDYPGSGIGLALCHKIITRHGGRIWVESQEGQGATFYFTIPVISNTVISNQ